MNIIAKLSAVINTLEGVEVKGRDNLDRVLGSIQALESVLHVLTIPAAPESEQEVENG